MGRSLDSEMRWMLSQGRSFIAQELKSRNSAYRRNLLENLLTHLLQLCDVVIREGLLTARVHTRVVL